MTDTQFDLGVDGLGSVTGGSSLVLTGDDEETLESVFYTLVSPTAEEQSVILSTCRAASAIERGLDDRSEHPTGIVTNEGRETSDHVTVVDDPQNLTELGLHLSEKLQTSTDVPRRIGVLHATDQFAATEDIRSVYRFLNTNLKTPVRRQSALGIVAVHTDVEIETDISSVITGMETSYAGRLHVEEASTREASITVTGMAGADGEYTVEL
jgi:hypothetical protein